MPTECCSAGEPLCLMASIWFASPRWEPMWLPTPMFADRPDAARSLRFLPLTQGLGSASGPRPAFRALSTTGSHKEGTK